MLELQPLADISEEEIQQLINNIDEVTLNKLSKRVREYLKKQTPL